MNFYVMTLFPELITQIVSSSIIGRAIKSGVISVTPVNIRDYTTEKHGKVDDYPYGGGAGMLMQAQPVYDCWKSVVERIGYTPRTIYLTPQAGVFGQKMAREFAQEKDLVLLCGHYEGIDERVLQKIVTDYVSIGDYVLTGGELPAAVLIDAISRMVPGTLSNEDSGEEESFSGSLLEYPQYTRPEEWMGEKVPDVLLSGHHANVEKWRHQKALERTLERRPELLENAGLSDADKEILRKLGKNTDEA